MMKQKLRCTWIAMWLIGCISAQQINFLPNIPYYSTNPYKQSMWNGLKLANPAIKLNFTDADELQTAAFAYMHPQSPYYMGASTYTRFISLLDTTLTDWYKGNRLADITNCFQGCYAYAMLKALYPDKIPANKKALWEAAIRKQIDSCFKSAPIVFINHYVRDVWLNGHQRIALAMFFGGHALGDSTMKEYARYATEEIFTQCLLNNGGTHYLGYHNEATTYHPVVVKFFLDYWLATGSVKVYNLLQGLVNYVPLNQHYYKNSKGYCEYSTGPSNKCYYNGLMQEFAAGVSAYISGDSYNWAYAKTATALEFGFIYKPGLTAKTPPDHFMLYDSGSLGPRARYGNWGMVATLRDPSSPLPEHPDEVGLPYSTLYEGKNTFVGAYILDSLSANWKNNYPLNAAFHAAGVGVKTRTADEKEWGRGNAHSWLTVNEKNAITKSFQVYGLSTRYQLNATGGRLRTIPWEGMQQWVMTPNRLVGMMEIQANQKQTVYGLKARLLFVSGRNLVSGTRKSLTVVNKYQYRYGMLQTAIHAENFKGIVDTQYVNIIPFTTNDDFSAEIELHDSKDSALNKAITYNAGTKRYALVEITNTTQQLSVAKTYPLTDTALQAFQFIEPNGRKIRMVHNISSVAVTYADTMYCPFSKARLMKSGVDSLFALTINAQQIASYSVSIPPYAHVLIVNSHSDSDHIAGNHTFQTVFQPTIPLPFQNASLQIKGIGNQAQIEWKAEDDQPIESVVLQKAADGIHFQTFYQKTIAIATSPLQGVVTDTAVIKGKQWYRLLLVYKNGATKIAATATWTFSQNNSTLKLYPNPAKNFVIIACGKTMAAGTSIYVKNMVGKTILHLVTATANNQYTLPLPANMATGIYSIEVHQNNHVESATLILQ